MAHCNCPPHGKWYCDWCADAAARQVGGGLILPRRNAPRPAVMTEELSEDAFRDKHLRPYALDLGWLHYHTRKSKGSSPGFPDEVFVHPAGGPLYLWELKTDEQSSQPSSFQRQWLDALAKVTHVHTGVYRPQNLAELRALLQRDHKETA